MKIKIIPVKQEYYPGETISGKIQIIPDKNTLIEDIEISLSFSEEWNYLLSDKKNEKTNNNQCITNFRIGISSFLSKQKDSHIILEPKEYSFPYKEKLPDYLLPSFEFSQKKFKAFLRYTLQAKIISSNIEASSKIYLIINSIPKIDNKFLIADASLDVKKWGMFNRGQTSLRAFYLTKNYRLSDIIPIEIEINNINSNLKVEKCVLFFIRKIIFKDKELFVEKYSQEDILIKNKFKSFVNKKEKKTFNFNLDLKTKNFKDFKYEGFENPYKNKQYNPVDLMPSLDGVIINCEYSLKIKLKFAHKVPKEDIPTVVMPIYIVHKLDKDHIEKVKKDAEKIKENEKNKICENDINEFEIIDNIDNEEKEKKDEKKEDSNNIINNNQDENQQNQIVVENKYDLIDLDVKFDDSNNYSNNNNKMNEYYLLNKCTPTGENNQDIQMNQFNNNEQYELDLPSLDTLNRVYQNKIENIVNNINNESKDNNSKSSNNNGNNIHFINKNENNNLMNNNNKDNKIDNKKGKKSNNNNGKKGNMIEKNNPNKGISSHKYDYSFNILLIGEEGVGKTEFLLKFTDKFTANHRETISK